MPAIGDVIGTLRRGGYSIRVVERDGMQLVECTRLAGAMLAKPVGDKLVLQLLRRQEEAIAYWVGTGRERERLRQEILAWPDGEDSALIAAKIAQYNILLGFERTSAGESWTDVRDEYLREAGVSAV